MRLFSQKQNTPPQERPAKPVLFDKTFLGVFTVSTTGRRLIAGGLFTLAMLALVLCHTGRFFDPAVENGGTWYGVCLGLCLILGILTLFRVGCNRPSLSAKISVALALLSPLAAMVMVETLNGGAIWNWSVQMVILNYILYMVFYGIVYVLSGSIRLPLLIINPLFFLLALTNYYVMAFRGTPFVPMDFFAAGTAANVAAAYDFSFTAPIVSSMVLLAALVVIGYKLRTPAFQLLSKIATRVFFGTLAASILIIYCFTDIYADGGLRPDFWNQARGYRKSGVVMNFSLNTKYVFTKEPTGYDPEAVDSIVSQALADADENLGLTKAVSQPNKTPHVICIMNESLTDLSVLGDVQTNRDYMPFLNSLQENTIRGNLVVPVIGSGTSNTEFEFLTGATTSFFPAGTNAYTLYIKNDLPSLVSVLEEQGFSSLAFHPYYASGWNRIPVYQHFGFNRFLSLGSVIPNSILSDYAAGGYNTEHLQNMVADLYPGQQVLVRRYVSDTFNYKTVIRRFEERDKSQPFFLFNVTMQNHGGYQESASNFDEAVCVTGLPEGANITLPEGTDITTAYPKTNQFLSLMKYSDDAARELITYFEQVDEPVVICLFGDHQPNVETDYIKALLGADSLYDLTPEQEQQRYTTPFYIWANYDIPEETVDRLSANYLSSYVMKVAGVTMPDYNRYLLKLSETLPVITNVGHVDNTGTIYPSDSNTPYATLLKDYEKVVYNYILDENGRRSHLYSPN